MPTNCFHCGLKIQEQDILFEEKHFCCVGCKTVYEILHVKGLENFYAMNPDAGVRPDSKENLQFEFLDSPEIFERLIDFSEDGTTLVSFYIPVIHCTSCVWLLESLSEIDSHIQYSQVDFSKKTVHISYHSSHYKLSEVAKLLTKLGYKPSINLQTLDKTESSRNRNLLYKLVVAGFCFGNIMLLAFPEYTNDNEAWLETNKNFFRWGMFLLSLPVMFYSATDFFKSAWQGLRNGFITIDLPIAIGFWVLFLRSVYDVVFDLSPGYFDSVAGLAFFMLIGRWFQQRTYQSLAFDRDYKSFYPIAIIRLEEGQENPVLLSDLKIGDRILIRNEEIVPADAVLIKGDGMIDNSFITGESRLLGKKSGDKIFAGGKQIGAAIELEIIKTVDQSYLTQLWNNESFQKSESGLNRLTNSISRYFVSIILLIAAISGVYWYFHDSSEVLQVVTAILIITCPCALALSSPFILGHVMRIFGEKNFYIKNTSVIETMAKIDHIVWDKTGTITENSESEIVYIGENLNENELISVNSIVKNSNHPLSRRLLENIQRTNWKDVSDYQEIIGMGQQGWVDGKEFKIGSAKFVGQNEAIQVNQSEIYISIDGDLKGKFQFANRYRKGLPKIIHDLNSYQLSVLSGDNDSELENLQKIFPTNTQFSFGQSPQQKLNGIKNLQNGERTVMMLGDGLNDSGALKQSDVGIVVSEDINNFSPSCDGILDAQALYRLPEFLRYSKIAIRLILLAFAISFLYNLVGLYFAVTGQLKPVVAAILMPISSISVVIFATLSTRICSRFVFRNLESL